MGPKGELPWDPLNLIAISKFPWQQFEDPNLGLWFPEIRDTPKNPKFQTGLEPVKITFQPHFWRFHVAFQVVVCPWARAIAEPKKVLAAESGEIGWKPTSFPIKIRGFLKTFAMHRATIPGSVSACTTMDFHSFIWWMSNWSIGTLYPLVNIQKTMENHSAINW